MLEFRTEGRDDPVCLDLDIDPINVMCSPLQEMQELCVRPRQQLLDLARAGAFGDHESNIERDVLRRSFGSQASYLNISSSKCNLLKFLV